MDFDFFIKKLTSLIIIEKGRPHRAAPITTFMCEECRISFLGQT